MLCAPCNNKFLLPTFTAIYNLFFVYNTSKEIWCCPCPRSDQHIESLNPASWAAGLWGSTLGKQSACYHRKLVLDLIFPCIGESAVHVCTDLGHSFEVSRFQHPRSSLLPDLLHQHFSRIVSIFLLDSAGGILFLPQCFPGAVLSKTMGKKALRVTCWKLLDACVWCFYTLLLSSSALPIVDCPTFQKLSYFILSFYVLLILMERKYVRGLGSVCGFHFIVITVRCCIPHTWQVCH